MAMGALLMGPKRRIAVVVLLVMVHCCVAPAAVARAATYGSDTYGNGPFNTGVDPAPPAAPTIPVNAGGGVISGPLSVGFVSQAVPSTTTAIALGPVVATSSSAQATTSPYAQVASTEVVRFARPLKLGDTGSDVRQLQIYLNSRGFRLGASGPGSPGHETQRFGALTYAALIRFQEANAQQILAPLGLTHGTGYFGSSTVAYAESAH